MGLKDAAASRRYQKSYREKHRNRRQEQHRKWRLNAAFGLSLEEYERLLAAQKGVCAICEQPCSSGRRLAVDHDHRTKKVRGLLCFRCNRALGGFGDDPSLLLRAANYLVVRR